MLRAGRGDRAAWATLFERHVGGIRSFARRVSCGGEDSDDVAQEVFLRVWRAAPTWQPRARFETWLRCVAYHVCLDRLRKKREESCRSVPDVADAGPGPAARSFARQLGEQLVHALATLPETQRHALVSCDYHGLPHREVAAGMGLSGVALDSLLARARRSMRFRLRRLERELIVPATVGSGRLTDSSLESARRRSATHRRT